jgi:hypothetical protein
MEHLHTVLCDCKCNSELKWSRLGDIITRYININAADPVPRLELGQYKNIIFQHYVVYVGIVLGLALFSFRESSSRNFLSISDKRKGPDSDGCRNAATNSMQKGKITSKMQSSSIEPFTALRPVVDFNTLTGEMELFRFLCIHLTEDKMTYEF